MYKKLILPASMLAGVIIGAGMFSLPFVFHAVGLTTGFFYLAVFALVFIGVYLMYADVVVRAGDHHRLVGFAKMFLGPIGFWGALGMGLVELFFVLTVYLILAPSFFALVFSAPPALYLIGFWIIGSISIVYNSKRIALIEFLILIGMLGIILLIFGLGIGPFAGTAQSFGAINWDRFFIAGPILFALSGVLAVPEVVSYFKESRLSSSYIRPALILGGILPALVYAGFVFGIIGLSRIVSEDAVTGLREALSPAILGVVGILGFLSLISSYIVVGLNARRVLEYDLRVSRWKSTLLVILGPILLYLAGLQNFLDSVSFIGSIFLPLEAMLVIVIWWRANRMLPQPPTLVHGFMKIIAPVLFLLFGAILIKWLVF